MVAADVGASTGGFTDCLLQHGAAHVVGVDVGQGQLHPRLREDARVTCIEQINARALNASDLIAYDIDGVSAGGQFDPKFEVIASDLSFISLTLVLPALVPLLADGGALLMLVKPQFELQPGQVGKGGIVRHVVGTMDPQGVTVAAFKKPTSNELAHDFLWRIEKRLPERGFIGVFDRSHYEDVLIGKVRQLAPKSEIERRYDAINDFESLVVDSGTRIIKVMLHISRDEQRGRLAERLERPDKHWKYNPGDVDERLLWDDYMHAYQTVFERTSTEVAPWYVVPANAKWYARLAVQELLLAELYRIDPQWPAADFDIEVEKRRLAQS